MAGGKLSIPRRTKAEMDVLLKGLPRVFNEVCGHTAPSSNDAYAKNGKTQGIKGLCTDCFKERYRDRARASKGQSAPSVTALKTAGHAYDIEKSQRGPEVEAALGVLRDHKAQRDGRQGYVYLISDGTAYKIGYSVNPDKRVAELQTGNPRKLSLLASVPGTEADERSLHQKYIRDNLLQEWFTASPELRAEFIKEDA